MGVDLLKLNLVIGDNVARRVEDDEAGTRSTLVQGADKGRHIVVGIVELCAGREDREQELRRGAAGHRLGELGQDGGEGSGARERLRAGVIAGGVGMTAG